MLSLESTEKLVSVQRVGHPIARVDLEAVAHESSSARTTCYFNQHARGHPDVVRFAVSFRHQPRNTCVLCDHLFTRHANGYDWIDVKPIET